MKNIFIISILYFSYCSSLTNRRIVKKYEITGIELTHNFPYIDNKGKLLKYDTITTRIYYYKDQTLYQLSYQFDSLYGNNLIKSEVRNHFFVHQRDKLYGYDYDKHKTKFNRKVLADSLFNAEWFTKMNTYKILFTNESKLVRSYTDAASGELQETYELKGREDTTMSGTCFLVYSKKSFNTAFSLSKELDSIKKMKLCRIELVNNSRFMKDKNFYLDRIVQTYTLKKIENINLDQVSTYFEQYIKDETIN